MGFVIIAVNISDFDIQVGVVPTFIIIIFIVFKITSSPSKTAPGLRVLKCRTEAFPSYFKRTDNVFKIQIVFIFLFLHEYQWKEKRRFE